MNLEYQKKIRKLLFILLFVLLFFMITHENKILRGVAFFIMSVIFFVKFLKN
jgi:hypothetical protein